MVIGDGDWVTVQGLRRTGIDPVGAIRGVALAPTLATVVIAGRGDPAGCPYAHRRQVVIAGMGVPAGCP